MQHKNAFTLVELIVVITILAILATVGFVSFSGYLAGARDTNRIAQLKSMSDALELYRTKKDLPIPDDKVDVQVSGGTIAYQGYIGANVLETIEYTEKGLDPKDKNYFTYLLTKDKKQYQLMAFLEEENEDVQAGVFNETKAVDYSERIPKLLGKKLGILTDIDNTPIQEISTITSSGYIDTNVETDYVAHIFDGKKLEGKEIVALEEIMNEGGFKSNLVAWYDMETISGTGLLDLSGNHHTGNIIGGFSETTPTGGKITATGGIIGGALNFEGNNITDYIVLPNEILHGKRDISISQWIKYSSIPTTAEKASHYFSVASSNLANEVLFSTRRLDLGNCVAFNYPHEVCSITNHKANEWIHIVFLKNGSDIELYVNGEKESVDSSDTLSETYIDAAGFVLGQDQDSILGSFDPDQAMRGSIDELRIYDGALTEGRIKELYNLGK